MRCFKRDMWKTGIACAGILIFLILVLLIQVSAAYAYEGASGSATPGALTVQTTPTEDATVTALNKEKLAEEVQQLKSQNELDFFAWLRTNASILFSTLAVVFGGLFGLWRWSVDRRDAQKRELEAQSDAQNKELKDRQAEREKRAEERFQAAVTGLGNEKEGARIGAAILLRTFLHQGYEQFYVQTFDLTVANLRLRRNSNSKPPKDQNTVLPLDSLSQALILVFKEAFPLARKQIILEQNTQSPDALDAGGMQLDNAYLRRADLKQVWMSETSMRRADLREAQLNDAQLNRVNLTNAKLSGADLKGAKLWRAKFKGADLSDASSQQVPES